MYVITSMTPNDVSFGIVRNGKNSSVHITEKFGTVVTDELTDKIIYLDSKGIVKYSEIQNEVEETHRGRKRNRNQEDNTNPDQVKIEESKPDEIKLEEGGK